MPKFLTTKAIGASLEQIIRNAKREVYLISPYIQPDHFYLKALHLAANKGISIRIVYGKKDLKDTVYEALRQVENIEGRFLENLHAKMYFNEDELLITSMNFYDFSEKNNREVGVFCTRQEDPELFAQAKEEGLDIWQDAERNEELGFCIRCSTAIEFDMERPFCYDCYMDFSNSMLNNKYENVCHCCGRQNKISFEKPVCYSCYTSRSM